MESMLNTVTKYLVQRKNCTLPCIGEFVILRRPAAADFAKKLMLPPVDEIVFTPGTNLKAPAELVSYIASKQNLDTETAEIYLKNYCEEWSQSLSKGGELEFKGFGTLKKNNVGNIYLSPTQLASSFNKPVHAEYVKQVELTGEGAVVAAELAEEKAVIVEQESAKAKDKSWWLFAAILFGFAIVGIIYHFNTNRSFNSIGNAHIDYPDTMKIETISKDLKTR